MWPPQIALHLVMILAKPWLLAMVYATPAARAPPPLAGGMFQGHLEEGGVLDRATFAAVPMAGSRIGKTEEHIWSDASTSANITKVVRVLRLHGLKQSAHVPKFLGLSTKTMSMVFVLKKFPSNRKALAIPLPHQLAHSSEGLFLKTSKGQRILAVPFGSGDMEVHMLVRNASAVARVVRKSLKQNVHLVHEITLSVDSLSLPVWNKRLINRGKSKFSDHAPKQRRAERGSMEPPPEIRKKLRTS